MQPHIPQFIYIIFLALLPLGATGAPNFKRDIQPILETNCVRCHKQGKS